MIWPTDALLLAGTKLKTRKIRLVITVIITSLLFGVLAFLASLAQGTIGSLKSFGQEGYGSQFFVQATPLTYNFSTSPGQPIDPELTTIQKDLVARKKAEAKRLSLTYDEKTDQNLPLQSFQSGPGKAEIFPNGGSPIIQARAEQKDRAIPGSSLVDFSKLARSAGATAVYSGISTGFDYTSNDPPQVSVLQKGQEDIEQLSSKKGFDNPRGIRTITTLGWRNVDGELLQPFTLPGQTLVTGKDSSVPVIAPVSAAEEILDLKALPPTATAIQKLERLASLRKQIAGKTAQLCYRNAASAALVGQTLQQNKEIANNAKNKDYVAPPLIYQLPTENCGPTTIKSDKRSAEEKTAATRQRQFDSDFGTYQQPEQGIVTVRVIGLNPDVNYGPNISPTAVLSGLLTSNIGNGWVSPSQAVQKNVLASKIQGGTAATAKRARLVYYAKFNSLAPMEAFIKNQACSGLMSVPGPTGSTMNVDTTRDGSATSNCINQSKVYSVVPYGNSAGAVEQFRKIIWKVARVAIIGIVLIAALIMMGNIGKIIADSRRETAVFRALGAKRLDITQIYLTYTVLISVLVSVSAIIIGTIAALVLNDRVSADLSVSAVLAYNAQDIHKQFRVAGFNPFYMLIICGLTIVAGVISATLPLLANTRRNPIRDMRDDT